MGRSSSSTERTTSHGHQSPPRRRRAPNRSRTGDDAACAWLRGANGQAQDALLALSEEVPDVMLLDINLPDLTGWELLRRLSPLDRQRVPVIAFSASPLAPSRIQELKPAGVLTKPFPVDALLRLLEITAGAPTAEGTCTDA
ncbi:MAG: hypothetical protein C4346_10780 [Chloroflexota bacterium]